MSSSNSRGVRLCGRPFDPFSPECGRERFRGTPSVGSKFHLYAIHPLILSFNCFAPHARGLMPPVFLRGSKIMSAPDSTRVIQGDDGSKNGHYRAKQDLREHAANSEGAKQAAELDPNDATSRAAQNPTDFGELRVGRASEDAAGIPAIWNTALYGFGDMGPIRAPQAVLKINPGTGFDCQSCAWPSPDKKRKTFEFCENGAKGVSDESTRKRIGPDFFAQYSIT